MNQQHFHRVFRKISPTWIFSFGVIFCTAAFCGLSARASTLNRHVGELAKIVLDACDDSGFSKVAIEFPAPQNREAANGFLTNSSARQMFATLLAEQLKHDKNVKVVKVGNACDALLIGAVDVEEIHDEGAGSKKTTGLWLQIQVKFAHPNTRKPLDEIKTEKLEIEDEAVIAQILGVPLDHHSNPRPKLSPLVKGFEHPDQAAANRIARGEEGSLFGVQIIRNSSPAPIFSRKGLATVVLNRDDTFTVKLINDAPFEVAVELTLDGVDSCYFTPQKSRLWLVPPRGSTTVKGWQLNDVTADRFKVTPFEKSVAGQLGLVERRGVIQAVFYAAWKKGASKPPGEYGASRSADGIGRGEQVDSRVRLVKRTIGRMRASVPIRYRRPR